MLLNHLLRARTVSYRPTLILRQHSDSPFISPSTVKMSVAKILNDHDRSEISNPTPNAPGKPRKVCVFCGASGGNSPAHLEAARSLAHAFHENNIHLVYGGGTVGVMGEIAKTLVSLSGPKSVHGIIPEALMVFERKNDDVKQIGGDGKPSIDEKVYGKTTIVKDMHTRKQNMAREVIEGGPGSGFVALTGGYGTLEELMEMVTWNQLGIHAMPVVLYNVEGYWDGLLQWVSKAVDTAFVSQSNSGIMVEAKTAKEVVQQLQDYKTSNGRLNLHWEER